MKNDIREVGTIGLVHHLLFPRCTSDPVYYEETLAAFTRREDIETLDCSLPFETDRRERLGEIIRNSGKVEVGFALHMYPLRTISLATPDYIEQGLARLALEDAVRAARAIGAAGIVFASGGPSPDEAGPEHEEAFREMVRWFCGVCAEHGLRAWLEPFDTAIDKKFLYGPTAKAVELIESLRPEVDNLGIELDMGHLPQMGEGLAEAVRTAAPYLERVHLGNCVLADRESPLYGDKHPPIGIPGGECDVEELATFLQALVEVGFLSEGRRGCTLLEITRWPGRSVEETIEDSWRRLGEAWKRV